VHPALRDQAALLLRRERRPDPDPAPAPNVFRPGAG